MANIYPLGTILNRPVGETSTETVEISGQPVSVTLTNMDDFVELTVTGDSSIDDACARCGVAVTEPIHFTSTLKVKAEATDDEIEDGVLVMDRHASVDLEQIVTEAIELARPTLVYCPEHQGESPKPFVIE